MAKQKTTPRLTADSTPEERRAAYLGGSTRTLPNGAKAFAKGNPGKHPGRKDRVPRSFKKMCEWLLSNATTRKEIRRAMRRGITSNPRHADRYIRLAAEYVDGKPVETQQQRDEELHREIAAASESLTTKLAEVRHALEQSAKKKGSS